MKKIILFVLGGLGAAAVGLLYVNHVYGPTEAEVASWGEVSLIMGLALTILGALMSKIHHVLLRAVTAIVATTLALLQIPPVLLWILFHNSDISDGTPSSPFVAHWAYGLPHAAVAALCVIGVYQLFRDRHGPVG